jgi:hypothetical protein
MIDLKNVISLIEIKFCKKVSCIVRKKGGDNKNWSVIFEGENEFKNVKLTDKDIEMVNKFRILSV